MMNPPRRLGALIASALFVVAACSGTASQSPGGSVAEATGGAPSAGSDVSGSVVVSGSSTVEPITALVAELFNERVTGDVSFDIMTAATPTGPRRSRAGSSG